MRKTIIAAAAVTLAMSACNSINDNMSWEEFSEKEAPKMELKKADGDIWSKTIKEGTGETPDFNYTFECEVEVQTLSGKTINKSNQEIVISELNQKNHDFAKFLVDNFKTGSVVEAYMPSKLAEEAGWVKDCNFSVIKAVITVKNISSPEWTITLKGKEITLKYGTSGEDLYNELGTPADIVNSDYVLTWIYREGKMQYMLNLEGSSYDAGAAKLIGVNSMEITK